MIKVSLALSIAIIIVLLVSISDSMHKIEKNQSEIMSSQTTMMAAEAQILTLLNEAHK